MRSEKTRQVFKPADFKGAGQYLLRTVASTDSVSYLSTVLWKVGYSSAAYYLVAMSDGMISKPYRSKGELCRQLNDDKHGYRFATDRELSMLVAYIGTRRCDDATTN